MNACNRAAHILRRHRTSVQHHLRHLNLQEYQSKQLLERYGCSVQKFVVADSRESAATLLKTFRPDEYVVKAQILAGGRGKGQFTQGKTTIGGVYITKDKNKVLDVVALMVGNRLVTKQTPATGVPVRKVMIADSVTIKRETYLAILMDREFHGPVIVASPAGGIDIEEVAVKSPNLIFKGIDEDTARKLAQSLGFKGKLIEDTAKEIKNLYSLFLAVDATQVEINPLVETDDKKVICVDAKLNFDDSAEFRQKEIFAMDEDLETDPREVDACKHKLNYVGLDGNIACLVNGAGLAMATMDIIKLHGGKPANFLDVGGAVNEDGVYQAFRILSSDPNVKVILVNIFGGIVNCATIAKGLVGAYEKLNLKLPLIVRLEGTNVEEARKLLANSHIAMTTADCLDDAGVKAVKALSAS